LKQSSRPQPIRLTPSSTRSQTKPSDWPAMRIARFIASIEQNSDLPFIQITQLAPQLFEGSQLRQRIIAVIFAQANQFIEHRPQVARFMIYSRDSHFL